MATVSTPNKTKDSNDSIKSKILDYLKSQKAGASVLDLEKADVVSYDLGCQCLTELELDGFIVQKVSPYWEVK